MREVRLKYLFILFLIFVTTDSFAGAGASRINVVDPVQLPLGTTVYKSKRQGENYLHKVGIVSGHTNQNKTTIVHWTHRNGLPFQFKADKQYTNEKLLYQVAKIDNKVPGQFVYANPGGGRSPLIGKISRLFSNREENRRIVEVQWESSGKDLLLSIEELAPKQYWKYEDLKYSSETCDEFKTGDIAYFLQSEVFIEFRVTNCFEDKMTEIKPVADSGFPTFFVHTSKLRRVVSKFEQFSTDSRVFAITGKPPKQIPLVGRIQKILDNGTIGIKWESKEGVTLEGNPIEWWKPDQVFEKINFPNEFNQDQPMYYLDSEKNLLEVRVENLFKEGTAEVDVKFKNGIPVAEDAPFKYFPFSKLERSVEKYGNLKMGDEVVLKDSESPTLHKILRVFSNGSVELQPIPTAESSESASRLVYENISSLSHELTPIEGLSLQWKVGEEFPIEVKTENQGSAIIKRIFNNGVAEVEETAEDGQKKSALRMLPIRSECAICRGQLLVPGTVGQIDPPCKHTSHFHCLATWLSQGKKTCPECRRDLTKP